MQILSLTKQGYPAGAPSGLLYQVVFIDNEGTKKTYSCYYDYLDLPDDVGIKFEQNLWRRVKERYDD